MSLVVCDAQVRRELGAQHTRLSSFASRLTEGFRVERGVSVQAKSQDVKTVINIRGKRRTEFRSAVLRDAVLE